MYIPIEAHHQMNVSPRDWEATSPNRDMHVMSPSLGLNSLSLRDEERTVPTDNFLGTDPTGAMIGGMGGDAGAGDPVKLQHDGAAEQGTTKGTELEEKKSANAATATTAAATTEANTTTNATTVSTMNAGSGAGRAKRRQRRTNRAWGRSTPSARPRPPGRTLPQHETLDDLAEEESSNSNSASTAVHNNEGGSSLPSGDSKDGASAAAAASADGSLRRRPPGSPRSRREGRPSGGEEHFLSVAMAVEDDLTLELEEELSLLAEKTRLALRESYVEVDRLRRENDESANFVGSLEAELRELEREKEGRENPSASGAGAGGGLRGGGRLSRGRKGSIFSQLSKISAGLGSDSDGMDLGGNNDNGNSNGGRAQRRISSLVLGPNRRSSEISMLSSDDEDDSDAVGGLAFGSRLRESFSMSFTRLTANLTEEHLGQRSFSASSMGSPHASLSGDLAPVSERPPATKTEADLRRQIAALKESKSSALESCKSRLLQRVAAEDALRRTESTNESTLADLRSEVADVKVRRNRFRSESQTKIIRAQEGIQSLSSDIDRKTHRLEGLRRDLERFRCGSGGAKRSVVPEPSSSSPGGGKFPSLCGTSGSPSEGTDSCNQKKQQPCAPRRKKSIDPLTYFAMEEEMKH